MTIANLQINLSHVEQWAAHKHAELDCYIPDDESGRNLLNTLTRLGEAANAGDVMTVLTLLLGETLAGLNGETLIKID